MTFCLRLKQAKEFDLMLPEIAIKSCTKDRQNHQYFEGSLSRRTKLHVLTDTCGCGMACSFQKLRLGES